MALLSDPISTRNRKSRFRSNTRASQEGNRRNPYASWALEADEEGPICLGFGAQIHALLEMLRRTVANGTMSERGLAKSIGMSQPHVHHLLSGDRTLTVPVADRLLEQLHISLRDLLDEDEVLAEFEMVRRQREPRVAVPMLSGRIGPRGPAPAETTEAELMECRFLAGLRRPRLVMLGEDREMASRLGNATHCLLHDGTEAAESWEGLFAVHHDGTWLARRVRPGMRCCYLVTAQHWNQPERWQAMPKHSPKIPMIALRREPGGLYSIAIPEDAAASW